MLTDENGEFEVIFYPNPFNNELHLHVESPSILPVSMKIFDVTGKLILETYHIQPNRELLISETLAAGMYFAQVVQGEAKMMVRILKEKLISLRFNLHLLRTYV